MLNIKLIISSLLILAFVLLLFVLLIFLLLVWLSLILNLGLFFVWRLFLVVLIELIVGVYTYHNKSYRWEIILNAWNSSFDGLHRHRNEITRTLRPILLPRDLLRTFSSCQQALDPQLPVFSQVALIGSLLSPILVACRRSKKMQSSSIFKGRYFLG